MQAAHHYTEPGFGPLECLGAAVLAFSVLMPIAIWIELI